MKNNILFISEMPPVDTYASSAVFYRHLKFLEDKGFNIYVLIDENSYSNRIKDIPASWKTIILPNRRWFFPPYKPNGLLQIIRFEIYYHLFVKDLLKSNKIDLIIGYVYGEFLSPFCAFLKKRQPTIPHLSFFHDDPAELNFNKNKKRIVKNTSSVLFHSDKVFVASKAFYSSWPAFSDKFQLLPPIPEQFTRLVEKKVPNHNSLVFGYSGSIYNELIPYFGKLAKIFTALGHKLILIGNNPKAREFAYEFKNTVINLPLFTSAKEANNYLLAHCDGYIIPYPDEINKMPWIKTCFPSKFIQVAQLGLPTIVIAPQESALGAWCLEKNWELYIDCYEEDKITSLISKLFTGNSQTQIAELRSSDFSPESIQDTFYKTVKDLLNVL